MSNMMKAPPKITDRGESKQEAKANTTNVTAPDAKTVTVTDRAQKNTGRPGARPTFKPTLAPIAEEPAHQAVASPRHGSGGTAG